MVNNIYNNGGLGLVSTYNKFSNPKQEQKQRAFAEAMNNDSNGSMMESIDTLVGSDSSRQAANDNKLNLDAIYKLSDTAQTLKEIAAEFNIKKMTLQDMKDMGNKLYDNGLISAYELSGILKDSEETVNSKNNAQDLLALWENKIKLLKENNSPRSLIDRAQHVVQIFRNIEAMHSEPAIDV